MLKKISLGLLVLSFCLVGANSASAVTLTLGAGTADSSAALSLGTSTATSIVLGSATAMTSFGGKLTGQLYVNDTGKTASTLKMHSHLATTEVANEFKGEFINPVTLVDGSNTQDGIFSDWAYTPTGATGAPSRVSAGFYSQTLTAANTITAGNLYGLVGQTIASGIENGATVTEVGVLGSVNGTGAKTAVSHVAGVASSIGSGVVNPTAGTLSSFLAGNLGTTVVDNTLYVQGAQFTTNLLNIDATGGMVTATGTAASGTPVKIKIIVGGTSYYMNAYPTSNN